MIWHLDRRNDRMDNAQIAAFLLFSALKFFLAPPAIIFAGYSLFETIIISTSGGIAGFILFYLFGGFLYAKYIELFPPKKKKKVFSSKRRRMVKYKNKYGFWGVAVLTPILFGVPLGALIAAAFFHQKWKTIFVFSSSIFIWSIILSFIYSNFSDLW